MKKILTMAVYLALALGAIPSHSETTSLEELRTGDMKKLVFHSKPKNIANAAYQLADNAGTETLEKYEGKYILLNFWATWCAPCRKEMPMLSDLQSELGGSDFEVVTIATGRNSPEGIKKFFSSANITNLPHHQDLKQKLASEMGVFGLPITVIIDPEGQEIARLRGDADWSSDSAKAIIESLIKRTKP